jgi:hypothetical protein
LVVVAEANVTGERKRERGRERERGGEKEGDACMRL